MSLEYGLHSFLSNLTPVSSHQILLGEYYQMPIDWTAAKSTFVKNMGMLGSTALLPLSSHSMVAQPQYKLGLQLYSIHENMTEDPIAALSAAKAMGYQDFETFGFDSEKGTFYGYRSSVFKKILDDLQLSASSGHFGFAPYLNKPNDEFYYLEQGGNYAKDPMTSAADSAEYFAKNLQRFL